MDERRAGVASGLAAYGLWGLFPLYFPLLEPAGGVEIVAHRVIWSLLFVAVLLTAVRAWPQVRATVTDRRALLVLSGAAVLIAANWLVFVYAVNSGHVVETSLGYFINPLVTVLMGVLVLGERLRRWQWGAMALATAAVVGITIEYGRPPWVALVLALSFGLYGLAKKQANVEAIESLTFETVLLAPVAIGFLVVLGSRGQGHFLAEGPWHALLLMSSGIITAIPLVCFGAAAIRMPMTTLGLVQYLAPILQFLIGVAVLHEAMSTVRWAGFALVWLALAIFTWEALHHRHAQLRLAAQSSAL